MKKPKIKNVYLVYKRSVYQRFFLDEQDAGFKKLFVRRHMSVKTMRSVHARHLSAVRSVQNCLRRHGLSVRTEARHQLTRLDDIDLVVTVGGDGTFLRTTHFAKGQLILAVNSDPTQSVGALCAIDAAGFSQKLRAILAGDFEIRKLPLMRISVNGKDLPIEAVNDGLFTNVSPAATSRYYLKHGKTIEEQKSSGIWVATATGSTAAISAAGGVMVPYGERKLQFAVREPYQGNFNPYRLTHGFIDPGKKITIINKMIHAKIYVDGPTNEYDLNYGDEVTFSLSRKTVTAVG